jgi:tetratricopeptide (TPR) repeat protein
MCREQLPVWQSFYEKHHGSNFEIIGIAMDAAAPDAARQFYDGAKTSFMRGVDRDDALWSTLDFLVVPNGIFIDEQGIVRYAKFGGFEARLKSDLAEIERLVAAPMSPITAAPRVKATSAPETPESPRYWFRLGSEALQKGDKETAARHWRKALSLDPKNFVIRKQIWALEHPEQFYPKINFEWQRQQLAAERKNEPQ